MQKLAIIPLQPKVIFVSFNAAKRFQELVSDPFVPNLPFLYPLETGDTERVHWEQIG